MTRTMWIAGAALITALAGCSSMPPPVPVIGSRTNIAQLTGQWTGEYHSVESRRSGNITFTLAADSDTAFGEVLMLPRRDGHSRAAGEVRVTERPAPRELPISFVMASGDSLTGVLDPYDDPECGCVLVTRFWGRIRGATIEGTYASTNVRTGEITHGEWKVKRRHAEATSTAVGAEGR